MGNHLVSVIIPTYNRAHTIGKAIRSILNQTYQNFEIIVVDDNSTDNTKKVVERIKDSRIRYFCQDKNYGVAAARNVGIKISKGNFIAFLDSDDEWLRSKLEKQVKILSSAPPGVAFTCCDYFLIKGKVRVWIKARQSKCLDSTLFRKDVFYKIGFFDRKLQSFEDDDIFLRITNSYKFLIIDEPLVLVHRGRDSISRNKSLVAQSLKYHLKKNYDKLSKNPKHLALIYTHMGINIILTDREKEGRMYLYNAINIWPTTMSVIPLLAYFCGSILSKITGYDIFSKPILKLIANKYPIYPILLKTI